MANVAIDSVIGALKHSLAIEKKSEIMWKERCKNRAADHCGRERKSANKRPEQKKGKMTNHFRRE